MSGTRSGQAEGPSRRINEVLVVCGTTLAEARGGGLLAKHAKGRVHVARGSTRPRINEPW